MSKVAYMDGGLYKKEKGAGFGGRNELVLKFLSLRWTLNI